MPLMVSLHHWQGWEVPCETTKPTSENLFCGSRLKGWQQKHRDTRHCSNISEMPFQTGRCQGQGQPTQTNTTAAPRTLYLCNLVLWPLLQPVIYSMFSCESLTKHCVMWRRNTQIPEQGQNHTTTKLRDKDFSLKCLQFFIQIQILSGGAPPPSPGVFSLWELCSYPVTFLWAHRFLTWSPTQAEGVTLLGCLIVIKSFCSCRQGQAGHSLPPTHSGCCCFSTT